MYQTTYHRPTSLEEAASLAAEASDDGKYLSGGMTLIPTMKQRLAAPEALIDLRHVAELKGMSVDGKTIRIGGGTTHAEIAASSEIKSVCPGFAALAGLIGDPAVRHMGTIGGSVANFDPAADYPAALLALGGTIHTNTREFSADDFFKGLFETALDEGEIVTAVSFEAPDQCAYEKFRNPASRYAMCGVFVAKRGSDVKVGVTGAGSDGAFRWSDGEQALSGHFAPDAVDGLSVPDGDMLSDIHGSSAYRANLVKVVTKRAVKKALGH
ncbi:xanthine dehydrogenase family protein subunit M [Jiella sp. MQZ9-1]|uniref:Xanthine dehydrogenase family protein subunit M n=1 Tax=Jiella flava TaxID=2816857 RepID=A0A939FX08_9HYPH|nr:xanthine dehydrogenase family protein subunit M [Jiella flava]MBO0661796.1 xanthine dehydrogenase family protein subunit M [Jiella flava]MCD2470437.1 xanthine dehydrogenase family protein subunit M [Jiella flava]